MATPTAHADVDSWAPIGWEPGDPGIGEAPFGSVLGDPLMGSPLFDVSILNESRESSESSDHRAQAGESSRGYGKSPDGGAQSDPTAALRARAEEQLRAMRRGTPRESQKAASSSGYGRFAGGQPQAGYGSSGYGSGRRQRSSRMQQGSPAQPRMPSPQMPYGSAPGRPAAYGRGPVPQTPYGSAPGRPAAYGRGPQWSGAPAWPVTPAGANPYAPVRSYGQGVRGGQAGVRPPQFARPPEKNNSGSYFGWLILLLFFIIWSFLR